MKIYLVGGAVRDQLLGRPHDERDYVVVGATPEEMTALGFKPVGKEFPVFIHPETGFEYALARTERKIGKGYKGFEFFVSPNVTLEEDLKRRDLTINAMAETPEGKIIDPYGGQQDLKNKILRHVSPAFAEDPVRILRVARFAARFHDFNFKIDPETMQLMRKMVAAGEVNALVPERVWQEFYKALQEESPEYFLEVLEECGALNILFPEIAKNIEVAKESLRNSAFFNYDPEVRFASMFAAENREDVKKLCERIRVPSDFCDLAVLVASYYKRYEVTKNASAEDILDLLEKVDAFRRPERFEQFLCVCDVNAKDKKIYRPLKEYYQTASQISVNDILKKGFTGKAISDELRKLRIATITKRIQDENRR